MKTYKQLLEGIKPSEKHVIFTIKKCQPPGPNQVNTIEQMAKMEGEKIFFVKPDTESSVVTQQEAIEFLQTMMPHMKKEIQPLSNEHPTVFHVLSDLFNQGYTNATIIVNKGDGPEYKEKINNQNGRFSVDPTGKDKVGYAFNGGVNVIEIDNPVTLPDSQLVQMFADGDIDGLIKIYPSSAQNDLHSLSGKIRARLAGTNDQMDAEEEEGTKDGKGGEGISKQEKVREQYKRGRLYKIGDLVECNDGRVAEVINLGTNYLTLVSEGKVFKSWLTEVIGKVGHSKPSDTKNESFSVKGYVPKNLTAAQIDEISSVKLHPDQYAVMNMVKAIDSLMDIKNLKETYSYHKSNFDRAVKYLNKFSIDTNILEDAEDALLIYSVMNGYYRFTGLGGDKGNVIFEQLKSTIDKSVVDSNGNASLLRKLSETTQNSGPVAAKLFQNSLRRHGYVLSEIAPAIGTALTAVNTASAILGAAQAVSSVLPKKKREILPEPPEPKGVDEAASFIDKVIKTGTKMADGLGKVGSSLYTQDSSMHMKAAGAATAYGGPGTAAVAHGILARRVRDERFAAITAKLAAKKEYVATMGRVQQAGAMTQDEVNNHPDVMKAKEAMDRATMRHQSLRSDHNALRASTRLNAGIAVAQGVGAVISQAKRAAKETDDGTENDQQR